MSVPLLNGKIGLALCVAFLSIFVVRILDNFSQGARVKDGTFTVAEARGGNVENPADLPPQVNIASTPETAPQSSDKVIIIPADRKGHFKTDIWVDHYPLAFLVDTGATLMVLRYSAAREIGLDVRDDDFTVEVQTANGLVRGASVRVRTVEIDGFVVYDVAALVLPDKALRQNLLGMNVLREFGSVEFDAREIRLYPNGSTKRASVAEKEPTRPAPASEKDAVTLSDMPVQATDKAAYRKRRAGEAELDKKKYTGYSD